MSNIGKGRPSRYPCTGQTEMPEIATIPTVHDLRRRWKPHKERLGALLKRTSHAHPVPSGL